MVKYGTTKVNGQTNGRMLQFANSGSFFVIPSICLQGLTGKLTKNVANEVISPSFKISVIPPYSSSSTFWKVLKYTYTTKAFKPKNLKQTNSYCQIVAMFELKLTCGFKHYIHVLIDRRSNIY